MKPTVAVDARMIRHSGIGSYLRRLLPLVIPAAPEVDWLLIGDRALLSDLPAEVRHYDLPIYSLKHHFALPKLLRGCDLLWTPHFNAPARGAFKQLVTIHDVFHLAMPELLGAVHKAILAKWWYRSTAHRASRIIAVSEFTKSEISRHLPFAATKVTAVHNFVEQGYADFIPRRQVSERPYLLTVGNIKPHKNLATLLKAFEIIKGDINADLLIVGQSEGFITGDPAVRQALANTGDRIRFPGFVEANELKSMYAGALCTVFPLLYEGFGLGPLESMTLGCPVVASNIPTTGEVCGDSVLTFDPTSVDDLAAKLKQIVADQALRERLRTGGLTRASVFTAERSVLQTADIIRSLVN